jgi:predicted xylose isomerase-like sugar epimerase
VRLHTLADVLAYAAAEGLTVRLDGTEATRPGLMHDQTAVKTEGIDELIEQYSEVKFLVDSGYRGLASDHPTRSSLHR